MMEITVQIKERELQAVFKSLQDLVKKKPGVSFVIAIDEDKIAAPDAPVKATEDVGGGYRIFAVNLRQPAFAVFGEDKTVLNTLMTLLQSKIDEIR